MFKRFFVVLSWVAPMILIAGTVVWNGVEIKALRSELNIEAAANAQAMSDIVSIKDALNKGQLSTAESVDRVVVLLGDIRKRLRR